MHVHYSAHIQGHIMFPINVVKFPRTFHLNRDVRPIYCTDASIKPEAELSEAELSEAASLCR
jgi:hypothetical protein